MPMAVPISTREPKRTVNQSVATPFRRTVASESTNQKPRHTTRKLYEHVTKTCSWWYPKFTPQGYKWKPKSQIGNLNPNVSMHLGNASKTANILEPLTPRFGSCFSEVYILDLKGNDLLIGSRGIDLYSITLKDTSSPNPICLMPKATSYQTWLWHRRLSYLNFDTINLLSKNDIVIGLLKFQFVKDNLCSSCELGKAKRKTFQIKDYPKLQKTVTTSTYGLMWSHAGRKDGENLDKMKEKVMSKSSIVTTADAPNQCQQQHATPLNTQTTPEPTFQDPTQAPSVTSTKNINQAEMITENAQVKDDEFINIFCTPIQDQGEPSSSHVDLSNMHTFYQRNPSEHRWMKDHPLEQVIENPSQSVRTRRQLESNDEMCMFALTVSRTEPKKSKKPWLILHRLNRCRKNFTILID
nr:integrase, catalytic region, zinc finger, CCHC-type, peptidase aspartic, catalytic [Tanacetum cinerariifolium]